MMLGCNIRVSQSNIRDYYYTLVIFIPLNDAAGEGQL